MDTPKTYFILWTAHQVSVAAVGMIQFYLI